MAEVDLGGALGDVVVSGPEDFGGGKVHAPAHLILTTPVKVRNCKRLTYLKKVHLSDRASLTQIIYHPLFRHPRSRRAGYISHHLSHFQEHMRQYVSAVRVVAAAEQTFREETGLSVMVAFTHLDQCNM